MPKSGKRDMLISLDKVSGITEGSIYPDFDGFARLHAHNKPYSEPDPQGYLQRGVEVHQRGDLDYNRAIQRKPDLAESYAGRGEAWLHLSEWERAKFDLTTARDMEVNIITTFHNDYASVPDFERIIDIKLPADIAAMLTP